MQDSRALANTRNLYSYRAWQRDGLARSGLQLAVLFGAVSSPLFVFVSPWIEHRARGDARALAWLMGAALLLYVGALVGAMVAGVLRLRAWRRAHPWQPPLPPHLVS